MFLNVKFTTNFRISFRDPTLVLTENYNALELYKTHTIGYKLTGAPTPASYSLISQNLLQSHYKLVVSKVRTDGTVAPLQYDDSAE